MNTLILFVSTAFFYLVIDMIWLSLIAKNIYFDSLHALLRQSEGTLSPNYPAAIIAYLAIIIGIVFFALPKANNHYSLAILWGGLLGFVVYGAYNFTNYSILAKWPINITFIDCLWGMILCSLTTCFGVWMKRFFTL